MVTLIVIVPPAGATTCAGARLSAGCCTVNTTTGNNCRTGLVSCYCDEVCRTFFNDCCADVPSLLNCNGKFTHPNLFWWELQWTNIVRNVAAIP